MNIKKLRLTQQNSVFIMILILCFVSYIYLPEFMQTGNVFKMLRQASALGVITMGQLLVMAGGGLDLSVAGTMQAAIVIFVISYNIGGNVGLFLGIIGAITFGLAMGLINGTIITRRHVPAFLVTLFTGNIAVGLRYVYTRAKPSGVVPEPIRYLGRDFTGIVPNALIVFLLIAAMLYIAVKYTTFGRRIIAVGTNKTTAIFSGIKADKIIITSYCLSGLLAVVAGVLLAGYIGYAEQSIGNGYDMDSLLAAVLGGNAFSGGKPSVIGAVGGTLLTIMIINIVVLFKLDAPYQYVTKGVVLIVAMLIGRLTEKFAA